MMMVPDVDQLGHGTPKLLQPAGGVKADVGAAMPGRSGRSPPSTLTVEIHGRRRERTTPVHRNDGTGAARDNGVFFG